MKPSKEDLLQFLNNEPELWIPVSNIIQRFPGEEKQVISILNSNNEFVKSARTENGEELFASRDQMRNEGNVIDKVLGAFKNRID